MRRWGIVCVGMVWGCAAAPDGITLAQRLEVEARLHREPLEACFGALAERSGAWAPEQVDVSLVVHDAEAVVARVSPTAPGTVVDADLTQCVRQVAATWPVGAPSESAWVHLPLRVNVPPHRAQASRTLPPDDEEARSMPLFQPTE